MTGIILLILRVLLAAALYAFLAWALYTIWMDLRQQAITSASNKVPSLTLTGADLLSEEYFFTSPIITVGRGATNDLVIGNDTVSVHHARLVYQLNQWWLQDLNSTNGTYLNGQRLVTSAVLTSGDMIGFGEVNLLVTIGLNPLEETQHASRHGAKG